MVVAPSSAGAAVEEGGQGQHWPACVQLTSLVHIGKVITGLPTGPDACVGTQFIAKFEKMNVRSTMLQ
jgi:hypothetical protein